MNLIKLVILLVLADSAIGQAHLLSSGTNDWYSYVISLHVQHILFVSFILYLIPYKNLATKTIVFIFLLTEIWDVVQFVWVDEINLFASILISSVVFVLWILFIALRKGKPACKQKDNTMIYNASKPPKNIWGFIPSLITGESGYKVLCGTTLYGFSKGKYFIEKDVDLTACKITETGIKADTSIINYLESKQGSKWKIYDNCITMQFKIKYLQWKSAHV